MPEAIIYARFSPRPDADTCESIERQIERCTAYCTAQAYDILEQHEDRDASGGKAENRPGLQAAIASACEHQATLVCASLSRLARNAYDALAIADQLSMHEANLVLLDVAVDTNTPAGRLFFTIMAALAEFERQQIRQRTKDALQRKLRSGLRVGRYAPYGYRITADGKHLEAEPSEQDALTFIRTSGESERDIGLYLRQWGTTIRGREWTTQQVHRIRARAEIRATHVQDTCCAQSTNPEGPETPAPARNNEKTADCA